MPGTVSGTFTYIISSSQQTYEKVTIISLMRKLETYARNEKINFVPHL